MANDVLGSHGCVPHLVACMAPSWLQDRHAQLLNNPNMDSWQCVMSNLTLLAITGQCQQC